MRKEAFVCDMCGAERKEANHWFVGTTNNVDGFISLYPWPINSMVTGASHLCGQACVHKFVDSFLSGVSK